MNGYDNGLRFDGVHEDDGFGYDSDVNGYVEDAGRDVEPIYND